MTSDPYTWILRAVATLVTLSVLAYFVPEVAQWAMGIIAALVAIGAVSYVGLWRRLHVSQRTAKPGSVDCSQPERQRR
jgi:hypothetical protein